MTKHTPGPWAWMEKRLGNPLMLATPDRGLLVVMDFGRKGMQGAIPRFAHWKGIREGEPRTRLGGILEDGIWLSNDTMHPDAMLIQAAPELLEALRKLLHVMEQHEQIAGCQSTIADDARDAIFAATGAFS